MTADEFLQCRHQVFGSHEARGSNAQLAHQFLVQAFSIFPGLVGQRDDARTMGIEALAGFGQAQLARGPVQQRGAKDGFQGSDVLADRGRGQPQFAGCLGKGAQLDHAGKDHHAGQVIHGVVFHYLRAKRGDRKDRL